MKNTSKAKFYVIENIYTYIKQLRLFLNIKQLRLFLKKLWELKKLANEIK